MRSELTFKEIKKLKADLQRNIQQLVEGFYTQTEVFPSVETSMHQGPEDRLLRIVVDVKVDVSL
jgi:hypothetical protein